MLLLSVLRTGLRYSRGQRPYAEDVDQMVAYMRRRCERGLPSVPAGRRGKKRAIAAVAHSPLEIAYPMLSHGQPRDELGANYSDEGKKQTLVNTCCVASRN